EMFYVDSIDVNATVKRGIDGMLKGLDPYTEYIPEEEMEQFKLMTTGEYAGVGAIITAKDGKVMINEPYEGMPAALAGLKAGDVLLTINGEDVSNTTVDQVSAKLKGQPNTKVKIKYLPYGEKKPREVEIMRKLIEINPVTYYGTFNNDSVGYIYLSGFTDKCSNEVRKALLDLKNNKKVSSLILDLRGNGGGSLEEAIQILNMFVPKDQVVLSTKGKLKQWDRTYRTTQEPVDTVMPLVVLTSNGSASASEIVSGALQDLDRAVIVGDRTFGKGLVQSTRDLPYNGSLKVTISKYYIPSGRCIQAIDYSHRNPDGSVSKVPDSLTTVFHTAAGRPVRDGGGIVPDFKVESPKQPTISYYLVMNNEIFDFVNDWTSKRKQIAPIEEFVFTDEDYEGFKQFMKGRNFSYDRQSEKALKNLKDIAEIEGYMDIASPEFKALEEKLQPNLDRDLDKFKDQIKQLISLEIAKRYYFQKGEMIQSLKIDDELQKALEVLSNQALYEKTLSAPVEKAKPAEASQPTEKK
ncbi:MAG: S41 family peptidase, partial [Tannerellaceae bacterium]